MKRVVPILITWDIDPTPEVTLENKKAALELIIGMLEEFQIKSTFLATARVADTLRDEIKMLMSVGQEIGCHGLTHGDEEEYNTMPEDQQRSYLETATKILQDITNKPIKTFRGPRVKTSHVTQKILEELGYTADCSIGSQRIDFISSNLVNVGWIFSPRNLYHPSARSAFERGDRKIWVVPISAIAVPFISSSLRIFGVKFMKSFFNILARESLRTGKPIVYLIHPEEFAKATVNLENVNMKTPRRIRTHGIHMRRNLYLKDEKETFLRNRELFAHMRSNPYAQFMTVNDFISDSKFLPPADLLR